MKVDLINYTQNAKALLVFTKNARLGLEPGRFKDLVDKEDDIDLSRVISSIKSSWEFVDYTFCITGVSRAFTHQLVRTRTGSYAQQSHAYVEMSEFDYVHASALTERDPSLLRWIQYTKDLYRHLLDREDLNIEDARGILPTNVSTNIVAKFNLRTIAQLVKSRLGPRNTSEIRSVTELMIEEILKVHPWAKDFILPVNEVSILEEKINNLDIEYEDRLSLLRSIDKMKGME